MSKGERGLDILAVQKEKQRYLEMLQREDMLMLTAGHGSADDGSGEMVMVVFTNDRKITEYCNLLQKPLDDVSELELNHAHYDSDMMIHDIMIASKRQLEAVIAHNEGER